MAEQCIYFWDGDHYVLWREYCTTGVCDYPPEEYQGTFIYVNCVGSITTSTTTTTTTSTTYKPVTTTSTTAYPTTSTTTSSPERKCFWKWNPCTLGYDLIQSQCLYEFCDPPSYFRGEYTTTYCYSPYYNRERREPKIPFLKGCFYKRLHPIEANPDHLDYIKPCNINCADYYCTYACASEVSAFVLPRYSYIYGGISTDFVNNYTKSRYCGCVPPSIGTTQRPIGAVTTRIPAAYYPGHCDIIYGLTSINLYGRSEVFISVHSGCADAGPNFSYCDIPDFLISWANSVTTTPVPPPNYSYSNFYRENCRQFSDTDAGICVAEWSRITSKYFTAYDRCAPNAYCPKESFPNTFSGTYLKFPCVTSTTPRPPINGNIYRHKTKYRTSYRALELVYDGCGGCPQYLEAPEGCNDFGASGAVRPAYIDAYPALTRIPCNYFTECGPDTSTSEGLSKCCCPEEAGDLLAIEWDFRKGIPPGWDVVGDYEINPVEGFICYSPYCFLYPPPWNEVPATTSSPEEAYLYMPRINTIRFIHNPSAAIYVPLDNDHLACVGSVASLGNNDAVLNNDPLSTDAFCGFGGDSTFSCIDVSYEYSDSVYVVADEVTKFSNPRYVLLCSGGFSWPCAGITYTDFNRVPIRYIALARGTTLGFFSANFYKNFNRDFLDIISPIYLKNRGGCSCVYAIYSTSPIQESFTYRRVFSTAVSKYGEFTYIHTPLFRQFHRPVIGISNFLSDDNSFFNIRSEAVSFDKGLAFPLGLSASINNYGPIQLAPTDLFIDRNNNKIYFESYLLELLSLGFLEGSLRFNGTFLILDAIVLPNVIYKSTKGNQLGSDKLVYGRIVLPFVDSAVIKLTSACNYDDIRFTVISTNRNIPVRPRRDCGYPYYFLANAAGTDFSAIHVFPYDFDFVNNLINCSIAVDNAEPYTILYIPDGTNYYQIYQPISACDNPKKYLPYCSCK